MTPIQFDKPRHLAFDLLAIKELETQMGGVPVGSIVQQLQQAGVNALIFALWAGLKHEDETLTPVLVTEMLTRYVNQGNSLIPLAKGLNAALQASGVFRGPEEASDQAPRARKRR